MDARREDVELAAMVGIDWADREHAVCLKAPGAEGVEHSRLAQTPEALQAWAWSLRDRFGGRTVGVCLEQSRGPLVYALSQYPWLRLYPINPRSLARYREALCPSRAKDDPTDAELLCNFLQKHRQELRGWRAEEELARRLRTLLEQRETLVDDRSRLINRLQSFLKTYYPQALEWTEVSTPLCWAFLLKWPSLAAVQRVHKKTLLSFFYAHHVRRGDQIAGLSDRIRQAQPLVADTVIIETAALMVQGLCRQLQALQAAIVQHEKLIAECFARHPDRALFEDLPGAGAVLGPRLLVAFGSDRSRYSDCLQLQQLSGIAPVVERSGRACWTHWRWAAAPFLRQSFHEFAHHSRHWSCWAWAYYQLQRQRGKDHPAAVRALAFKWIRILYRCWVDRVPYNEERYLQCLQQRGSHLIPLIAQLQTQEAS